MMLKGLITLVLTLTLAGCNGQNKQKNEDIKEGSVKPKTDIRVNKEFDEQGNLVRYDSSYSYYYSNIENDTLLGDSIYEGFREYFNQRYSFSNDPYFEDYFFEDSLLHYDFYKKDFFSNRFRRNMENMDQLFLEMDSLKNHYFFRQFSPYENDTADKSE